MARTFTASERRAWFFNMIPSMLLAALYGLIAISKAVVAINELGGIGGRDGIRQLLLTLHAASSAIFFAMIAVIMINRKQPIRRERRLVGWVLPFAVTMAMAVVGMFEPRGDSTIVLLIATAFVFAGTGFTIYALRHLGRHFGVVSDVRGLVTTGPYSWVRHPLYGGETLATIGFVVAVATPVAIAAFSIGLALQIWRARVEEQSLTDAFPEYRDYAARTPMLIPFAKLPARPFGNLNTID